MEHYKLRMVEMPEVVKELDRLWDSLQSDETLREDAADAHIDLDQLAGLKRKDVIEVESSTHGIDGATLIDVGFVSAMSGLQMCIRSVEEGISAALAAAIWEGRHQAEVYRICERLQTTESEIGGEKPCRHWKQRRYRKDKS